MYSLIGRAFSIFRQKMDGLNPSKMDIKVFIPAPTFYLPFKKVYSLNGKRKKCFPKWDSENKQNMEKYRMNYFK